MLDKGILSQIAGRAKPDWRTRMYDVVWTYIAKDTKSNTYKIGRSVNLRKRMAVLRSVFPYSNYNLELIAFTPCNIEETLQDAVLKAGGTLALNSSGPGRFKKELFYFEDSDIDSVLCLFCFQRTHDGLIPAKMRMNPEGEQKCLFFRYDILSWEEPPKKRILKNGNG